ncbi:MAG: hypothetical protein K5694_00110 [Bacilli bacterium]|nr:hypothetical protein [Bacilli bacterium]
MKNTKLFVLASSMLFLASCGGSTGTTSSSEVSTREEVSTVESSSSEEVSSEVSGEESSLSSESSEVTRSDIILPSDAHFVFEEGAITQDIEEGAKVELTFVLEPGYNFKSLKAYSEEVEIESEFSALGVFSFVMPGNDVNLVAEYYYEAIFLDDISKYSIIGEYEKIEGEADVVLEIAAPELIYIESIEVKDLDGEKIPSVWGNSKLSFTMPYSPVYITLNTANYYPIADYVTIDDGVESYLVKDKGNNTITKVKLGEEYSIEAVAKDGYAIKGFYDGETKIEAFLGQYYFTFSQETALSVTSGEIKTISLSNSDGHVSLTGGTNTFSKDGSLVAFVGDSVTLTLKAEAGYEVNESSIAVEGVASTSITATSEGYSVSFTMPEANVSVSAEASEIEVKSVQIDIAVDNYYSSCVSVTDSSGKVVAHASQVIEGEWLSLNVTYNDDYYDYNVYAVDSSSRNALSILYYSQGGTAYSKFEFLDSNKTFYIKVPSVAFTITIQGEE